MLEKVHINSDKDWDDGNYTQAKKLIIGKDVISYPDLNKCVHLCEIIVDEESSKFSSMDGVLYNKDKTRLIRYPLRKPEEKFTIPSTVSYISATAFKYAMFLLSVELHSDIELIGENAFEGVDLRRVEIMNIDAFCKIDFSYSSIFTPRTHLFVNGKDVNSTSFEINCPVIRVNAFRNLQLKRVVLTNEHVTIGIDAFKDCNLQSVVINSKQAKLQNYSFFGNPNLEFYANTDYLRITNAFDKLNSFSAVSNSLDIIGGTTFVVQKIDVIKEKDNPFDYETYFLPEISRETLLSVYNGGII